MSVPAQASGNAPTRRHLSEGVTPTHDHRDVARLIAQAATNLTLTDRALRIYAVVVTLADREVTAAQVAAALPALTEDQASRMLGSLVTAGLLTKRLRTIGYKDGRRVRRSAYSLTGVDL